MDRNRIRSSEGPTSLLTHSHICWGCGRFLPSFASVSSLPSQCDKLQVMMAVWSRRYPSSEVNAILRTCVVVMLPLESADPLTREHQVFSLVCCVTPQRHLEA